VTAPAAPPARGLGVPRWPAFVALLLIGGLYLSVSERLTLGPPWLPLVAVVALLVPRAVALLRGHHLLTRRLGLLLIALLTLAVVASTAFLVGALLGRTLVATVLLRSAAVVWVANLLTFAVWYWEIDAGGPGARHRDHHASADFVFPQLAAANPDPAQGWSPGFVDYLVLAFNTSTAFSPTDTMILSRRAKLLMMLQSLISLVVIAVLAARAINTL
jgi:hypothetical protein